MNTARIVRVRLAGWFLMVAGLACAIPAFAAPPILEEPLAQPLAQVYRARQPYVVRMTFRDPDGDPPVRAQMITEGPSGIVERDVSRVVGTDYQAGVTLEWDVQFEPGTHRVYFVATTIDGTTRYPPEPNRFLTITAETLGTKLVIMGVGLVVCLVFIPFLVYVVARSVNRRGDPARAARIGLLIGILACTALFIYLFASFYGPLAYGIGIVAALALLVVVLTRR